MSILLIDNYDSFTYNLKHYLEKITDIPVTVVRNDEISVEEVNNYQTLIISPGPGLPDNAGITKAVISTYATSKKILGVCLGHQAIGEVFGAKMYNLDQVQHGVASEISIDNSCPLFEGMPLKIEVGRYHSWVVDEKNLPEELRITATDKDGKIMAMQHINLPIFGVQFHPESIMTPHGLAMIRNFILL
jgi:anthranilate synthase component II